MTSDPIRFLFFASFCSSLRLLEVKVPVLLDIRDEGHLSCTFALEGDRLFSVKWYKEEHEFYRFMPGSKPAIQTFFVPGVNIVRDRSNVSNLILSPLEYTSTGLYRCEVSSEGPHFTVDFNQSSMTVLGLPQDNPRVEGVEPSYTLGSYVSTNCTSSPSNPPARMEWYINGQKAQHWLLDYYYSGDNENPLGLETRTVGLKFQVEKSLIPVEKSQIPLEKQMISLMCAATVANVTRTSQVRTFLAKLSNEKFIQNHDTGCSLETSSALYLTTIAYDMLLLLINFSRKR